jgi:glycine hydroxymethyltransferase
MAKVLQERGYRIVSGRTDCHMFLVDLRDKRSPARGRAGAGQGAHHGQQERGAERPQKPFVTSGVRIGSPAMTTRGFAEPRPNSAHLIADVLDAPQDEAVARSVRGEGEGAVRRFRCTSDNDEAERR